MKTDPFPFFSSSVVFRGKALWVEVELCPPQPTEGCIVYFFPLSERVGRGLCSYFPLCVGRHSSTHRIDKRLLYTETHAICVHMPLFTHVYTNLFHMVRIYCSPLAVMAKQAQEKVILISYLKFVCSHSSMLCIYKPRLEEEWKNMENCLKKILDINSLIYFDS